jgi:HSP20 family protein
MSRALRSWRGTAIRPLEDLYRDMDNLVQHLFGEENRQVGRENYAPMLNLSETEGQYELTADLPGIKPENVSVEVHEGQITISGQREAEKEETNKTFHRVERQYGEFRRTVSLPVPVDEQKITASYKDGVLTVVLPKSEKVKPKRIPVQS